MPTIPEHEATGQEELARGRCSRVFLDWGKVPERLWESRLIGKAPADWRWP
jgi:hypothetical protein